MQDSVTSIITDILPVSFGIGLSLGFITWFSSWSISQVIHLFKAISR